MRRDGIQLSPGLRLLFYGVFVVLFATGAAWWILQEWGSQFSSAGTVTNAFLSWLMKIHGAAAMAALVVLGVLYPLHILRGWQARRNRSSGVSLGAVTVVLIVSGYLLYYSGGENLRLAASRVHLWLGLGLPAVIGLHVRWGRASRSRSRKENETR